MNMIRWVFLLVVEISLLLVKLFPVVAVVGIRLHVVLVNVVVGVGFESVGQWLFLLQVTRRRRSHVS